MKNIRLIIFDLDGTLVDAYQAINKSFNFCMRKLKLPVQDGLAIRRAVGWGDESLLEPFVKPQDLKKTLLLYRRHHRRSLLRYSRLLPGARQLLSCLKKKGFKLAVASNRPTEFSWILIKHLGLKKYFDYVLCADRLKYGKPNPQILIRIMQHFKVSPEQALYIGDMAVDARAARRARVKAIIVLTGSSSLSEIKKEKPYQIIPNLNALATKLELDRTIF